MIDDGQSLLIVGALGIALLLGACTVGPDFERPHPALPPSWAEATDPGKPAPSDWWKNFGDPALDQLIARADAANLDMRMALERVDAARIERGAAVAQGAPIIGGHAAYSRNRLSTEGVAGLVRPLVGLEPADGSAGPRSLRFDDYSVGGVASWELDLWGRQRRLREAAGAQVDESIADADATRLSTRAEVVRTYFRWRELEAVRPYLNELVGIAEQRARITEALKARGFVGVVDLNDPQEKLRSSRVARDEAVAQARATRRALAVLVGGSPDAPLPELEGPLEPVFASAPATLPSTVLRNRPDILAAEARLHAATAAIGVAKADFYPSISLTGQLSIDVLKLADFGWPARNGSVGPSLTLPIFDGGRLRRQLALTKSRQRTAALAYQATVMNAWREVEDALATERLVRERLMQQSADVAAQRMMVHARQRELDRGEASTALLIGEEAHLLDLLISVAKARCDLRSAEIQLMVATG